MDGIQMFDKGVGHTVDKFVITYEMVENSEMDQILPMLSEKEKTLIEMSTIDYETGMLCSMINCESPIERLMAIGMYEVGLYYIENFYPDIIISTIDAQFPIEANGSNYKADFRIATCYKNEIHHDFIIECDGHDFHERTKEQAKRDRQRERNLIATGYTVVRFTGSEIYLSPYKCAKEVIRIIVNHYIGG